MKYWECLNVPGKTNVEGAKTSAPSLADTTVLSVGNVEPDVIEAVKNAVNEAEPVQVVETTEIVYTNGYVDNERISEMSDEYKRIFNQAFNRGEVDSEPVTEIEVSEENDTSKYVSVDEVDVSEYDTDGEFEVPEVDKAPDDEIIEASHPTEDTAMVTEKALDKDELLRSIFSNGGEELATTIAEKVVEKVVETPEPEFSLDEEKLKEVIDTLDTYERMYFEEIPIKHLSQRFLRNITKEVYKAHQDAVMKYEDPPIMDPIFLMYPLTTEDPYMAMGKFWDIVMNGIQEHDSWQNTITKSINDYNEYVAMEEEELKINSEENKNE